MVMKTDCRNYSNSNHSRRTECCGEYALHIYRNGDFGHISHAIGTKFTKLGLYCTCIITLYPKCILLQRKKLIAMVTKTE